MELKKKKNVDIIKVQFEIKMTYLHEQKINTREPGKWFKKQDSKIKIKTIKNHSICLNS